MVAFAPKTRSRTPKLRLHKGTGQGYVELNRKRIYLGLFEAATTREKYHRLIAEWEAGGRQLLAPAHEITIVEIVQRFWPHAKTHYQKTDRSPAGELENYRQALRPLINLYGTIKAKDFGPRALKGMRHKMVELGWARTYINRQVSRVKSVFRWATEEELIAPDILHGLSAVGGLQRGRTEAHETDPVKPVPESLILGIQPYVSEQIWALIQLQLRSGARAGELIRLRGVDLKPGDKIWTAELNEHKTAHHGISKRIYFGPQAVAMLQEFLQDRPLNAFLFSPAEAEVDRRRLLHEKRVTPLSCGNKPGTNRAIKPLRQPNDRYDVASYRRAIQRACERAFPPPTHLACRKVECLKGSRWETSQEWRLRLGSKLWEELQTWKKMHVFSPGALRHNAATRLRHEWGIEVAQCVLGHRLGSSITEIYAEANVAKAIEAIQKVG